MQYVHVIRRSLLIAPVQAVGSQRCTAWFVYLQARSYGGHSGAVPTKFLLWPQLLLCPEKIYLNISLKQKSYHA